MAVTTIFAGAADADLNSNSAVSFSAANNGATISTPVGTTSELWIGQFFFATWSCYESFVDFDLSSIHFGQEVSAATLQTWLITDNSAADFNCAALLYDWGASVTSADWQDVSEMDAAGTWWTTLATAGIGGTGAYKSWNNSTDIQALCTLFAGSEINFCLTTDLQISNVEGGTAYVTFSSTNVAGTTQDPKITITHQQILQSVVGAGGMVLGGAATITTIPLASIIGGGGVELGGSASMAFTHGPAVASDVVVEWDLDGDGDFSEPEEDITSEVLDIEWSTGRNYPSALERTSASKMSMTLRNETNNFNFNNSSSPYATAPFSLATGRKVRVRTASSTPDDPELLVRDRFDRADSIGLGSAETGQTWTIRTGGFDVVDRVAKAKAIYSTDLIHTIDCGQVDHYVQCSLRQLPTVNRRIGFILKWVDAANYVYAYMDSNPAFGFRCFQYVGGVLFSTGISYPIQPWEGMTIGVGVVGSAVSGYINGALVDTGTVNAVFASSTEVGVYAFYLQSSGRAPEVGDFHVWDHVAADDPGVLWTGTIDEVKPTVEPGPRKLCTVSGSGPLAAVARPVIAAPRLPRAGAPTGLIVGDVFHRAGALHPPSPLDPGAITTGTAVPADGAALKVAQEFETMEQGWVVETRSGHVTFHDSDRRASAVSEAVFSDTPGMQFGYTDLEQLDPQTAITNRVTAGVAPLPPSGISLTARLGGSGTAVDLLLPTTAAGDLLVIFIATTVNDGADWNVPIFWTRHRDLKAATGMRVYSRWCDGTESGDTITLYNNNGGAAGLWGAYIYRITGWFQSSKGVAVGDFVAGDTAGPVLHGWGREPTLFITTRAGMGATVAGTYTATGIVPDGYYQPQGFHTTSGVNQYDVGLATAYKIDAAEVEQASAFGRLTGFDMIDETVTVAIRGFNGPHTKATLDNPNTKGGDGIFVTTDDTDSQDSHQVVATHDAPRWFATEADAETYNDSIIARYAEDRPVLTLEYFATKSGHYRNLAIDLKLGSKITAQADQADRAGLGLNGDYFIESEHHQLDEGLTRWIVRYEVSPA